MVYVTKGNIKGRDLPQTFAKDRDLCWGGGRGRDKNGVEVEGFGLKRHRRG